MYLKISIGKPCKVMHNDVFISGPISYTVCLDDNRIVKRHYDQLRNRLPALDSGNNENVSADCGENDECAPIGMGDHTCPTSQRGSSSSPAFSPVIAQPPTNAPTGELHGSLVKSAPRY
ncbi:hypothetical protein ACLKA7_000223 [Drosophila subpalustris]